MSTHSWMKARIDSALTAVAATSLSIGGWPALMGSRRGRAGLLNLPARVFNRTTLERTLR